MLDLFDDEIFPEEENFSDDPVEEEEEAQFNPQKEIRLDYGTETVFVDLTNERYAGKTLAQIAAMLSNELGFSRDPNALNYKLLGNYIEGTLIPTAGQHYTASASRDTKG